MCTKPSFNLILVALACVVLWMAMLWLLPASALGADGGALFASDTGSGTACSQAQPCALQVALDRSVAGDVIYVAAGTYTASGAAVVTITKGITLYGGWDGASSGPLVRDPVAHRSILDGQGSRRVVYISGDFVCGVDGFTIRGGNATAGPEAGCGGGVYIRGARPTIAHNVISGNRASASPIIDGLGGGLFLSDCQNANLSGNWVLDNTANEAAGHGGGLWIQSSGLTMTNNIVAGNYATDHAGGLALAASDGARVTATLLHNTIADNDTGSGDGRIAIHAHTSRVRLTMRNNLIAGHTYGVFVVSGSSLYAYNTLFFAQSMAPLQGAGSLAVWGTIHGRDPLLDTAWHLGAASPAVDAGVNAGVTIDIDGDARPAGYGYDIGADECTECRRLFLPVLLRGAG